jgi:hypothetical protein
MPAAIQMQDRVFGRLLVVDLAGKSDQGELLWQCLCECGRMVQAVRGRCLRDGVTKSCGCLRIENGAATGRRNKGRRACNA